MNMSYKQIGNRIKSLRKARKITQKELGAAIGRTESSIAKYEQGLVEIPNTVLISIANFLGIELADLLEITPSPVTPTPFSALFNWLESLGYKIVVYEEEEYRAVLLRDVENYVDYTISDDILRGLADNVASYSRFQISEIIKAQSANPGRPEGEV